MQDQENNLSGVVSEILKYISCYNKLQEAQPETEIVSLLLTTIVKLKPY